MKKMKTARWTSYHLRHIVVFLIGMVLSTILVLSGCSAGAAKSPAQESATSQENPLSTSAVDAKASTPLKGDAPSVLRIGTTRPIKAANPISDYWFGVTAGLTTHDSLASMDGKLEYKPRLAQKWESLDQGRVWKFQIAQGAKWHDGTPVTPEDVKFNIEYRKDKDPQSGWMKDVLESVDLEGDTVTIRLNKPYGTLLVEFNTYVVLPKHIWEKVDDPLNYSDENAAIGCGPYVLEKFDPNAGLLSFKANEEYYMGKPEVDRLEFRIYKNVDSMTMALSKGDVDVIWDYSASVPYTSVEALAKVPEITLAKEVDMGVPVALGFNMAKYPMSELPFREAVSYAINYPQIAEFIFAGYGKVPTAAFVPPSMPFHDEKLRSMQFDPKKAADLLDSMGLKDVDGDGLRETPQGEKLKLTLLTRTDSAAISRSGELLQGYLKSVGIDASLKALDSATWVALKDKMDYDLVLYRTTPWGMLMHSGYGSGYFDSRRTGAGVLHNVDDKAYLELCDKMLQTTDPADYRELALQLQRYYAEQLPSLALAWGENVYPYRGSWQGWQMNQVSGGVVNRETFFSLR